MPKYKLYDGSIYEGATITMPDGRIKTGETLTADSQRCFPLEAGDEIVRARKPDGTLKADDKATPDTNEAWVAKKPVKKKASKK